MSTSPAGPWVVTVSEGCHFRVMLDPQPSSQLCPSSPEPWHCWVQPCSPHPLVPRARHDPMPCPHGLPLPGRAAALPPGCSASPFFTPSLPAPGCAAAALPLSSTPPPPPRHFISFLERRVWAGDFLFLHLFLFFFPPLLIKPLSCSSGSGGADRTARHGNCLQPLPEPAAGADLEAPMELHFMFVLLRGAVGRILSLSVPPASAAPRPRPSPLLQVWGWGGDRSSLSLAWLCRGCHGRRFFPAPCPPLRMDALPVPGRCRDAPKGSCPMGQALQTPPSPSLSPHKALSWCYQEVCGILNPQLAWVSGWVTAEEMAKEDSGCSSLTPSTSLLSARLGDIPCRPPQQTVPVPWGQQTQDGAFLLQAPLLPFGVWLGESHAAAHPALPLPGCPHQDQSWEHLARGGTPLPTASGCRSRAEVQRFVLISLSKPTKRKFPHGKPLIFECARMCWKPSRWKIPNPVP